MNSAGAAAVLISNYLATYLASILLLLLVVLGGTTRSASPAAPTLEVQVRGGKVRGARDDEVLAVRDGVAHEQAHDAVRARGVRNGLKRWQR